jgi:hypothetical protein
MVDVCHGGNDSIIVVTVVKAMSWEWVYRRINTDDIPTQHNFVKAETFKDEM